MEDSTHQTGLDIRRAVLGDAYVGQALSADGFGKPLQDMVTSESREVPLHTAPYRGVPATVGAFRVAKKVLDVGVEGERAR